MQLFLVDKVISSKYIFVQKCTRKSRALGLIWIVCGRGAALMAGMHILRLETIHSNMDCLYVEIVSLPLYEASPDGGQDLLLLT